MMMMNKVLSRRLSSNITLRKPSPAYEIATIPSSNLRMYRYFSATSSDGGDSELKELMDYLNNLKNFEKSGVPKGAGTDSEEGFDLGRMKRLMGLLGNPQSNFKVPFLSPFALLNAWALSSSFLFSSYFLGNQGPLKLQGKLWTQVSSYPTSCQPKLSTSCGDFIWAMIWYSAFFFL